MKSRMSFFPPKHETHHLLLRELFLKLLNETEKKCKQMCTNTYEQERHFMISFHPEIEQKKISIDKAKERVLQESGVMQEDQDELFYSYASGLSQLKFDFLFMHIFAGKIKKHWLPVAEKYPSVTCSNPDATRVCNN